MHRLARPLHYAGIVVAVLGLGKVAAFRHSVPFAEPARLAWSVAYIALLAFASYALGLPDNVRSRRQAWLAGAVAGLSAIAAISMFQLLAKSVLLPRSVVLGAGVLLVPWFVLCASLARAARSKAAGNERVVFVGEAEEAGLLRADLAHSPERPAVLVGTLTCAEAKSTGKGLPLLDLAESAGATLVVLDRTSQLDEHIVAQAALLHERGARVRTLSLFYEQWLGKMQLSELERVSLMFDIGEIHRDGYGRVKRVFDVVVALLALPLLLIAIPCVAVVDLVGNRGPVFFKQQRIGKSGREFTIWKFRTMRTVAETDCGWTAHDDPRITRMGRMLRVTHIDELPQLINVVRGDLSIVGPRPQPMYVTELIEKIPFYGFRHLVRPGMTGWRQVKFGYAGSDDEALEALQYDFFYLRHQSLVFDLRIVGRTLRSVVGRNGR